MCFEVVNFVFGAKIHFVGFQVVVLVFVVERIVRLLFLFFLIQKNGM